MARADLIQTNFTGGELSPSIALGRVDIAKYNNGAKRIENCVLTVQGGAKRRPGSRFIRPTKDQTKVARLIEFVYNRGQAYVLELGEGYVRFIKERAYVLASGSPYEVVSPYTEAQLPSVNYVQKADTAFLVHEAVYPQRLQRYADAQWGMANVPFITAPTEEQGLYLETNLTLSQATPGAATVVASANTFLNSDVGRHIIFGGGDAVITGYTDPTHVAVTIRTPFPSTVLASGQWNLDGSPQASIAPSALGAVGQTISLSSIFAFYEPAKTIDAILANGINGVIATVTGHGYSTGDTISHFTTGGEALNGTHVITVVDTNTYTYQTVGTGGAFGGTARRLIQSPDGLVFHAQDHGSVVILNGGMVEITDVASNSIVNAKVLRPLTSIVPVGANAWSIESPAWNERKGYPRAVTINKQRLIYGGSPGYPQNIWASRIQEYLNFQFGTNDDDAFRFELDGPRNSPIRHLVPARQMLVLTEADEMSLKGGQEKPITATNIQKTDESTVGASSVRPVKIGNEMVFVQAAGKKVSAIGYRYEIDGFSSPDRTVFAAHITGDGVIQTAHQKEPDSQLYAVRSDGQIAVCAYDIDQEVTGWSRWITNGAYESIATVPTATSEDAYAIVRRTVGGVTKRYVEVFDPDMLVDCGISGTHPTGQATWTGLDHLEGETVQAWADGAYLGTFEVDGGAVTLTRPAKSVQIGLGFTPLIEMLQPESGGNGTTAQGSQVHVNEVILRVLDTSAAVINGQPIEFRRFGPDLLDLPPPLFSGDVRATTLSDEIFKTSQIITQPYPLPFHLLDVIRRVTINN